MAPFSKVLVVDDDPTQTIILHAYFTGMNCDAVFEADSAAKALVILGQEPEIDLIVSDLMMPDMDGIELLRALKDVGFSGKVALVSSVDQTIVNSARKLGELHQLNILGTCRKPLTRQILDDVFQKKKPESIQINRHEVDSFDLSAIASALEQKSFIPYYQPKIDVLTKRIAGVEVLARWQHSDNRILSPASFMPIIEENHLTRELTFGLLEHALTDLAQWEQSGLKIKVAVNITANEVSDLNFPRALAEEIAKFEIEPSKLSLEVTENEVLEFNAITLEVLSRLRMMGIDVAIDDFGTGYSNLKVLKEFPYTELKIDQSFISGMTKDPFSQESVRAAVTLGRQLNMRLVAEGVETAEEWDFVKQRGIDEVQGFYLAKPMSAVDFINYYNEHNGFAVVKSSPQSEAFLKDVLAPLMS